MKYDPIIEWLLNTARAIAGVLKDIAAKPAEQAPRPENAAGAAAAPPAEKEPVIPAAEKPESPAPVEEKPESPAPVEEAPESPAPVEEKPAAASSLDVSDAILKLRGRIIESLNNEPAMEYMVGNLFWNDAADCFGGAGSMPWDGAWLKLNLQTHKLYALVSTYPNAYGATRDDIVSLDASRFHKIAVKYNFDAELQALITEADWESLFDHDLNAAVAQALAVLEQREMAKAEEERIANCIHVPENGTPKLDIRQIRIRLIQPYGSTCVEVTVKEGSYFIHAAHTYTSVLQNRDYSRQTTPAEAAWIETETAAVIADPNDAAWQSLPGGDTMSVCIERKQGGNVSFSGRKPFRKYTDLLYKLDKLARYGSIQEKA